MITKDQAASIWMAASSGGLSCSWRSEGYTYSLTPASDDCGPMLGFLELRNPRDVSMLLTVKSVGINQKGGELRICTEDGFTICLPIGDGGERMAGSEHIFGEDGYCIWCATPRDKVRTKSCPMCPYDDGLAYLEEVGEP